MKANRLRYMVFETRLGWLGLLTSTKGLRRVVLPQALPEAVLEKLGDFLPRAHQDGEAFGDLPHRLRQYFEGKRVEFPDQVDLTEATSFQKRVWEKVRSIPYGETRSYAWVAREIGRPYAFRAVGQALKCNPLPIIIPCHRVIGSVPRKIRDFSGAPGSHRNRGFRWVRRDGQLVGFGEGIELKKKLLQLEGCWPPSPPSLSALSWRNR